MNKKEQSLFFYILRRALWGNEHDAQVVDYEGVDSNVWSNVLTALEGHGLLAFAADALMRLNEELPVDKQLPPMKTFELLQFSANIAQTHFELNNAVAKIFGLLEEAGVKPILLKGQGLAAIYPIANTRSCGDIDIYVGEKGYSKAKEIIDSMCSDAEIAQSQEDPHQYHIAHGDIIYELHPVAGFCADSLRQKKYEKWSSEQLSTDRCEYVNIKDYNDENHVVAVPNLQFNVTYLFDHLCRHLRFQGVGFRQFVDIAILLHQIAQKKICMDTFEADLRCCGLLKAWKLLSGILVINLGLPEDECPLYDSQQAIDSQGTILDNIIRDMDFGAKADWRHQEEKYKFGWQRVLVCYKQQWKYFKINYRLFPVFAVYEFLRQTTRTLFISIGIKKEN